VLKNSQLCCLLTFSDDFCITVSHMMHIVAQKAKTVQKCSECMGVTRLPVGILKTGRLGVSGILFLLYTPKKLVGWAAYQGGMVLGWERGKGRAERKGDLGRGVLSLSR